MGNIIANIITGIIKIIISPLPRLHKNRILARILGKMEQSGTTEIKTPRGNIKLNSLKGVYAAKRVEKFWDDEPELLEWINQFREGETFWDIGSNIGIYSLFAGTNPKITVYSFEPSAFNFGLLVEHIRINNMGDRIKPFCMAFSSTANITSLLMKDTHTGHGRNLLMNSKSSFDYNPAFAQSTPVFSIDNFIDVFGLLAPDHIKIDVDGAEA
jgi:FkbM family methyltransferase